MVDSQRQPLLKRLGWFVLLWVGGVLAVMLLAWLVRLFIPEY